MADAGSSFFLLFWTNLIISRYVLDNIPCCFWGSLQIIQLQLYSNDLHLNVVPHLRNAYTTRLSLISPIKYLPACDYTHYRYPSGFHSLKPIQNNLSKHTVLCFVSIENNQERKVAKQIANRFHNIHNINYGHLDISLWYTNKNFISLFYLTIPRMVLLLLLL